MKPFLATILLSLSLTGAALADSGAPYVNFGNVTAAPAVDAPAFENFGTFQAITTLTFSNLTSTAELIATPLPYATRDTLYFTNTGTMTGVPGFRFDTATAKTRFSAVDVVNRGTLIAEDTSAIPAAYSVPPATTWVREVTESQPIPSQMLIFATNVINSGEIGAGNAGVLEIVAKNFVNQYGSLAAGGVNTGAAGSLFDTVDGFETVTDPLDTTGRGVVDSLTQFFVNPPGVYDLFWGVTNVTSGTPVPPGLDLAGLAESLPAPNPLLLGFRGAIGGFGFGGLGTWGSIKEYASYLYVNPVAPTNVYFNIVLVNTNFLDTNLSANVSFSPEYFWGYPPGVIEDLTPAVDVVQFAATTTDVLTGELVTNAFYLIDNGAQLTNMFDVLNAGDANQYSRPFCFEITTSTPFEWEDGTNAAQTPFDPTLIYESGPGGSYLNSSVPWIAGEYGAQIGRDPETLDGSFTLSINQILSGTNLAVIEDELLEGEGVLLPDPTNEPGRIEITAGQADLTAARIRAEGIVEFNVTNLIGAGTGVSDWGITDANIGKTNGELVLANFFPTNFQRVRGSIHAWGATWQNVFTNAFTTNTYHMHVLVVDQALRGSFTPSVRNLRLNGAKSVEIQNDLTVINHAVFDTTNLIVNANVTLTQGAGNLYAANTPKLESLVITTNGSLSVDSEMNVGYSLAQAELAPNRRRYSITNFLNLGSVTATAPLIQSEFFTNDGTIFADDGGSMAINAGQLTLGSVGPFSTDTLESEGNVTLSAESMQATNSLILAENSLILDVAGNLTDGVSGAPNPTPNIVNQWEVAGGIDLTAKPATGDLFGTEVVVIAPPNALVDNVWAGTDMGASPAGFVNNAVIGRLVLDRLTNSSTIRFSGAGAQNALYVDYLELTNFSVSDYREGLIIDPNIKIYFADSNVDPFKLMDVYPGGLIWVSNFVGPNSTAAVPYLNSTNICLMNAALATSTEIGFFGIPNFYRQPYILNDPKNSAIVAPCPGDVNSMTIFVTSTTDLSPESAYHSLIVAANGEGTVGPKLKSEQLEMGSADTLTATPAQGWTFDTWSVSGLGSSSEVNSPVLKFVIGANGIITANFIPNPFGALEGVYNGLFYDPASGGAGTAGFFTLTVKPNGAFSGRLLIGAGTYSFSSRLNGKGSQQVQATSGGKSVTVNLQLDMSGATKQVSGDVNGGTWDSPLTAELAPVWTAKNAPPFSGRYTMALRGDASMGDSYAAVSVSALGVVSVAGSLADGTSFNQLAAVSASGEWPFYAYSGSGRDTVFGWVELGAGGPAGTNVTWIKAPGAGGNYPAGFAGALQVIGSPYAAPAKNSPAFGHELSLTLSGGGLSVDETMPLALEKNLGYASGNVTLSVTASTGVFKGHFGAGQPMSGVILQNQDSARGYFLGTNSSGAVLLQGN
jgi:hypothetical protein